MWKYLDNFKHFSRNLQVSLISCICSNNCKYWFNNYLADLIETINNILQIHTISNMGVYSYALK